MDELEVWINDALVGYLRSKHGIWQFEYHKFWRNSPEAFSLSEHLPLEEGLIIDNSDTRPVQWFFDNLLPEEKNREILAKHASSELSPSQRITQSNAFELLRFYGQESAGAITILEPGTQLSDANFIALPDEELSQRIQNHPHAPLASIKGKRMSLAGAQYKLPVIYEADTRNIYEPIGNQVSTHILKPEPEAKEKYYQAPMNEWFTMTLAGLAGLDVPPVYLKYVPEPVYIIERFDRFPTAQGALHRSYVLDGCQFLSIMAQDKYRYCHSDNINNIVERCNSKALTRKKLFEWIVFNFLVGNDDCHMKNLSFIQQGDDTYELAPFYDLLSISLYSEANQRPELVWPMGNVFYFHEVTRADVVEFARQIQIPATLSNRIIDTLPNKVLNYAQLLHEATLKTPSPCKGAEQQMLRRLINITLKEHVQQLA